MYESIQSSIVEPVCVGSGKFCKFRNQNHSHDTVFSKYIWELRDSDKAYDMAYNQEGKCLQGKPIKLQFVPFWETLYTVLNEQSQLVAKCRHENKYFARNHRTHCSNHPWIPHFHHKTGMCFQNFKYDDRLVHETASCNSINFHPLHLHLYRKYITVIHFFWKFKNENLCSNFYFFRNWKIKKGKSMFDFHFFLNIE